MMRCRPLMTGLLVAGLLVAGLAAAPAGALDRATSAFNMAQNASKAYEGGDYSRAAELYLSAWKTDAKPSYLWALARAEHLAGKHDRALEHYRLFLSAPGDMADRVPRALEYIDAVLSERTDRRADEADKAMRVGEPRLAAQLYLDAFKLGESRGTELLFKAAVAEQAAELWQAAAEHFEVYLQRAPATAADRGPAAARLEAVRRKLTPARAGMPGVELANAATPAVGMRAAEPASRAPAWALAGSGALLAAGGAGLLALTWSERNEVAGALAETQDGQITGLATDEAYARIDSVNRRLGVAAAMTATGVAALGAGAWWLWGTPSGVGVAPGPTAAGVSVVARF